MESRRDGCSTTRSAGMRPVVQERTGTGHLWSMTETSTTLSGTYFVRISSLCLVPLISHFLHRTTRELPVTPSRRSHYGQDHVEAKVYG